MFCATTIPCPDATTDFGEMVPPMLCASSSRVVSDGGELGVVVVVGARVVVVGFAPAVVDVDVPVEAVGAGFAESEPPSAARLAIATPATISTQTAAMTAIRAPGRNDRPGGTTIAATLPVGSDHAVAVLLAPLRTLVRANVAEIPLETHRGRDHRASVVASATKEDELDREERDPQQHEETSARSRPNRNAGKNRSAKWLNG